MSQDRHWNRDLSVLLSGSLFLLAFFGGCGSGNSTSGTSTSGTGGSEAGSGTALHVVATVAMVGDLATRIGGDRVRVTSMMGPGVDPHLYKATRDDVRLLMDADVILYCGLMLEGKILDTLEKVGTTRAVYAVTDSLSREKLLEPDDFPGHADPHVWMDVALWSECIAEVVEALSEVDPEGKAEYIARGAAYEEELKGLDQLVQEAIGTIPEKNRILITSHDAFNYLGRRYGLEVRGVQGLSTESEAGLQQINELVDLLVERRIPAVFVESSVPRKNMEALLDGARWRGHDVQIGGELFSDCMGAPGSVEGTYPGMILHNIRSLVVALGGTMNPPRGTTIP